MGKFKLKAPYKPTGDQPQAIEKITKRILSGKKYTVLLGITGSGKTFTMANIIYRLQRPALVIAPNKTLAAQLFTEFREFFPENAVGYFISYYDYYQPEAYIPSQDLYIEKDTSMNEDLDRLRHAATTSLFTRRDCIIVASVSCIYGLGDSKSYAESRIVLQRGQEISPRALMKKLVAIGYRRNQAVLERGTFRLSGDALFIFPADQFEKIIRIDFFDDYIERILFMDNLYRSNRTELEKITIFPATHYLLPWGRKEIALEAIRKELNERIKHFEKEHKFIEAQRLAQRTLYDLEMIEQTGTCPGIENYSRHLTGRKEGEPPATLLDYFPDDFIVFIDESHITIPQLRAMYRGDRSRKETLVEYGFRLPSCLDNRPLTFEEFLERTPQIVFVSATPGDFELNCTHGEVVEQLIRPTGLVDPECEIRNSENQIEDVIKEVKKRAQRDERSLITTLTKRMAEVLSEHFQENGIRARYLHSEIDTLERSKILRELRRGDFDCLIGINLLREGLDLPEVSLVAILDADREGFLRSERALIQTMGRAARNINGKVILYGERITEAMRKAVDETNRRRKIQIKYNKEHNITPQTIKSKIKIMPYSDGGIKDMDEIIGPSNRFDLEKSKKLIEELTKKMFEHAQNLEFEEAAKLRDRIKRIKELILRYG